MAPRWAQLLINACNSFFLSRELLKAKDESTGAYPDTFKHEGSHDLQKLPRFQSYRGFFQLPS
jgi:hypothetical protein